MPDYNSLLSSGRARAAELMDYLERTGGDDRGSRPGQIAPSGVGASAGFQFDSSPVFGELGGSVAPQIPSPPAMQPQPYSSAHIPFAWRKRTEEQGIKAGASWANGNAGRTTRMPGSY